jgi:hypothetical protein
MEFKCIRCGKLKPSKEFHPHLEEGVFIRNDCCYECCRVIDALREKPRKKPSEWERQSKPL